MLDTHWTPSEKRIARRVYDAALERELAAVLAEFKQRAASAKEPGDIWDTEEYLTRTRKEIDGKYDYRYSQLERVFGWLLREGRITEDELTGLAEDKIAYIKRFSAPQPVGPIQSL
jgi:Photoprotection regulator fluorescence recovery protein